MKKILAFVSIANQLLIFLAIVIVIFIVGGNYISTFLSPPTNHQKIEIVNKNNEEHNNVDVEFDIRFSRDIKDVFVFNIYSNVIEKVQDRTVLNMFASSSGKYDSPSELRKVNLLFTSKLGGSYRLMEENAYIYKMSFYKSADGTYNNDKKLSSNFYLIISQDTNGDGFLSSEDSADLFVSDYDGKHMAKVLDDVDNYEVVQSEILLIEKNIENNKVFYTYEVPSKVLSKLDTSTMRTSN